MILLVTLSKSFCNSRIVLHHFGRFLENTSRKLLSSLWTFRVSRKKEKKARICHQTRIKRTFASAVHVDRVSFEVNNRGNRPSVLNISIIAVTGYTLYIHPFHLWCCSTIIPLKIAFAGPCTVARYLRISDSWLVLYLDGLESF